MINNLKRYLIISSLLLFVVACGVKNQDKTQVAERDQDKAFDYPQTKKVDVVEDYHGTAVEDPYRWLEIDTAKEVGEWVKAQNKVTNSYLAQIPFKDSIKNRLTELLNYERMSAPSRLGGNYYFFSKNDGLQNQSVIYIQKGIDGKPEVYLDPNKLSEAGTVSIGSYSVSNDGKYFAYSTQSSGSDWQTIYVTELESKKVIDTLTWVKFSSPQWYKDGFFYSRFPKPQGGVEYSSQNRDQKVYYHKVNTPQAEDKLIYEDPANPLHYVLPSISEKGNILSITNTTGTSGNAIYLMDLSKGLDAPLIPVVTNYSNDNALVGSHNGKALIYTNLNAPNYRLVAVDLKDSKPSNWKDILPNRADHTLEGIDLAKDRIIATYMKDASSRLMIFNMDGKELKNVHLPAIGTVGGINTNPNDSVFFYTYSSFIYPSRVYKYDLTSGTNTLHFQPKVAFDPEDFVTKQEFVTSKDGTKIPMFIVHKKGLAKNGNNPAYLYGYGGFNVSMLPSFSSTRIFLLENDFVYAMPSLRGGGEYGEEWHEQGMLLKKQNVFDDFIGAAEYLIEEGYTHNDKLAIAGGSNGGLLVGAAMTQRPELFAVALPAVGVMDMLRYHKFTVGHGWVVEYGSAVDPAHFPNLYGYSPIHNIEKGTAYPATLVTTADHDDRVVPAHSFKFIATLQEKHGGEQPVLIRIATKAGHGAGKPVSMVIEEYADVFAFIFRNVNELPN